MYGLGRIAESYICLLSPEGSMCVDHVITWFQFESVLIPTTKVVLPITNQTSSFTHEHSRPSGSRHSTSLVLVVHVPPSPLHHWCINRVGRYPLLGFYFAIECLDRILPYQNSTTRASTPRTPGVRSARVLPYIVLCAHDNRGRGIFVATLTSNLSYTLPTIICSLALVGHGRRSSP